ncbi:MAG TPA: NAD(P)/FAD-dependent oxidoreductase [Steroidobacteraceae bacterium]|nr:NAD(P)/FAD-dependent oxidoreductase [Steroidobacteraceae bacterium]
MRKGSVQKGGAPFDAIVIGSGIGGLACACALTRSGLKVLVLERHFVAGGLTQTFRREGFSWAVGLHYLGDMGAGGSARTIMDWLSGGALHFAPCGPVYDTVHLPGGFEFQFARPQEALVAELKERFPASQGEIDVFFEALLHAERAGRYLLEQRAMPSLLGKATKLLHHAEIDRWWGRTTETVLQELISDPRLRAVLAAQRGDYGPDPRESSFGLHALVMRHYMRGAYFPVGGADAIARTLVPVIVDGGGEVRTRASVSEILIENDGVAGVRLKNGTELRCPLVFSDVGAHNTLNQLLPAALRESEWAREINALRPSACHIGLYLGFREDIRSRGATASNHWFYESLDIADGLWHDPALQPSAPALYVTFPSLKDPSLEPQQHTAELVTFTDWDVFSRWEGTLIGRRPADYRALKTTITRHLLAQFGRHFPALAPLVVYSELSTPLSTLAFTGAQQGAVYGLEPSPRRFLSPTLRAQTPVPGLYLTGQDVGTAGITGAMTGGILAAAALEPNLRARIA